MCILHWFPWHSLLYACQGSSPRCTKALLFYSTCRLCCACIYSSKNTRLPAVPINFNVVFSAQHGGGVWNFFSLFNKYKRQLEAKRLHGTDFELILHSKEHSFRYQGSINQSHAQKSRISNSKKYSLKLNTGNQNKHIRN